MLNENQIDYRTLKTKSWKGIPSGKINQILIILKGLII